MFGIEIARHRCEQFDILLGQGAGQTGLAANRQFSKGDVLDISDVVHEFVSLAAGR
jgi:hypothetical protein